MGVSAVGSVPGEELLTSISPWIVTLDALDPFRRKGPAQDPAPLPHLASAGAAHFDIQLEVSLGTSDGSSGVISRTNAMELYWSYAQQIAHLTSNGCNMEPGDLYASGTISGEQPGSFGSLLELSWRGSKPVQVGSATRSFLEDGDTLTISGWCQGDGFRVGFGEVSGTVLASD